MPSFGPIRRVELVRALGGEAGVVVDVRLHDWWSVLRDLDEGRVDLVSLPLTDDRARRYELVAQTWTFEQEIVFPAGASARALRRRLHELTGRTVAVVVRHRARHEPADALQRFFQRHHRARVDDVQRRRRARLDGVGFAPQTARRLAVAVIAGGFLSDGGAG